MSDAMPIPETRVLAIASHVVYGYVGNTMVTFVMQTLGAEVAALNTVHFSNHTGYGQTRGTKATASEILDVYKGLQQSNLTDFDMMLSGYAPSAEAVDAIGQIGRDLRAKAAKSGKPGSFFWVLDPVMGDEGRIYVPSQVPPAYTALLPLADLILPNQFEAELLTGIRITSLTSLHAAMAHLHAHFGIPHVLITSVHIPYPSKEEKQKASQLCIFGSTATSNGAPRIFKLTVPQLPCFFSGTGDMLAALTVVRLREAVLASAPVVAPANKSETVELIDTSGWRSPDSTSATELPLCRATEKSLSSMQTILEATLRRAETDMGCKWPGREHEQEQEQKSWDRLRWSKAAEVRVVRFAQQLRDPRPRFHGVPVHVDIDDVDGVQNI